MIGLLAGMAREHLASGRALVIDVQGHSMWPFLRDRQRVRILPATTLALGDVVLFEAPRRLVLHRVIGLAGDRLTTKGDARPAPDGVIDRSQVIGRLDVVPCALFAHASRFAGPLTAALLRRLRLTIDALVS